MKKFIRVCVLSLLFVGGCGSCIAALEMENHLRRAWENYMRSVLWTEDVDDTTKSLDSVVEDSYRVSEFLTNFEKKLSDAIEDNKLKKVKKLVETYDKVCNVWGNLEIPRPLYRSRSPIDHATETQSFPIVQYLRQQSSIMPASFGRLYPPRDTRTLFFSLKREQLTLELTQYIISCGANRRIILNAEVENTGTAIRNIVSPTGNALYVAARNGDVMLMDWLMEDIIDNYDQIIDRTHSDIIRRRIAKITGVRGGIRNSGKKLDVGEFWDYLINIDDCNGRTALYFATDRYCSLKDSSILNCLKDYLKFVDVALPQIGLNKTMIIAVNNANSIVLEYCLSNGACIESQSRGLSAMMIGSKNGYLSIVKFLIEHGANVNARTKDGRTPLMFAAGRGVPVEEYLVNSGANADALSVVEFLVNNGADVNASTNEGKTALMLATERGDLPVINFLKGHGANANVQSND